MCPIIADGLHPQSVSFVSATPSQGECTESEGVVTCDLGIMSPNAEASVLLKVLAPDEVGTINNTAEVSSPEEDAVPGNNTASQETAVSDAPLEYLPLAINPTSDLGDIGPGDGTCSTGGLVEREAECTLRAAIEERNATSTASRFTFDFPGPGPHTFQPATPYPRILFPVIIDGISEAPNGDSPLLAQREPGAPEETAAIVEEPSSGEATSDAVPTDSPPNLSKTPLGGSPEIDLSFDKTGPSTVKAGENITYELTITNGSNTDATGLDISEDVPDGTTFVSSSVPCQEDEFGLSCQAGDLPAGQSKTITITFSVQAAAGTEISNAANVLFNGTDPSLLNNSDSHLTTVISGVADLGIQMTGPGSVPAGFAANFDITVTNGGPDPATDVQVTNTLPDGLTFYPEPSTAGCTVSGSTVTCPVGTLANGESRTIRISAAVDPNAEPGSTITNSASVGTDAHDDNPVNNTSPSVTIQVTAPGETKVADPNTTFFRLFVIGQGYPQLGYDDWETDGFLEDVNEEVRPVLESSTAQASDSSSVVYHTPTKKTIEDKIKIFQELAHPGDEVTFYFKGHGDKSARPDNDGDEPNDDVHPDFNFDETILINKETDISDDELADMLEGFRPGVTVVVILDACYAGGFTDGSGDIQENPYVTVIGVSGSCKVDAPGPLGAFVDTITEDIAKGVRSGAADANSDGVVTAEELKQYLVDQGWDIGSPSEPFQPKDGNSACGSSDGRCSALPSTSLKVSSTSSGTEIQVAGSNFAADSQVTISMTDTNLETTTLGQAQSDDMGAFDGFSTTIPPSTVQGLEFRGGGPGLRLDGAGSIVHSNLFANNDSGLIVGSNDNMVHHNQFTGNSMFDVRVDGSTNMLSHNLSQGGGGPAILGMGDGNTFATNHFNGFPPPAMPIDLVDGGVQPPPVLRGVNLDAMGGMLTVKATEPGSGPLDNEIYLFDAGPGNYTPLAMVSGRDPGSGTILPGVYEVIAVFSGGAGECGFGPGFTDFFEITISPDGTIAIRQPSTNDANTGTINPDGTFSASQDDPPESYTGQLNADGSGTAVNMYTDSTGCTSTWQVTFSSTGSPDSTTVNTFDTNLLPADVAQGDQIVKLATNPQGSTSMFSAPFPVGLGADPVQPPPEGATAWKVLNPDIGHEDGPFALPGAPNPDGLTVVDPANVFDEHNVDLNAFWGSGPECAYIHLHGFFFHDDPESSACGHGGLLYIFDEVDADTDGVGDDDDACSGTGPGAPVDANGCSDAQVDEDGDGVCNSGALSSGPSGCTGDDACSGTPSDETPNAAGCSASQVPSPGLELTVTDDSDPSPIENPVNYIITVTNNGPASATNVKLTGEFDVVVLFSLEDPENLCSAVFFSFDCDMPDLSPNGGRYTIGVTKVVPLPPRGQFPVEGNVVTLRSIARSAEGDFVEVSESTTFIRHPDDTSQTGLTGTQAVLIDEEVTPLTRIKGGQVSGPDAGCDAVHLEGVITVDDQRVIADLDPPGCSHGPIGTTPVLRSVPGQSSTVTTEAPHNAATKPAADSPHSGGIDFVGGIIEGWKTREHLLAQFLGGPCPCPEIVPCEGPSCGAVAQDAGDPVYLHSGELFLYEVDLRIPGRGFDWTFERKYRSGALFDGPLGHNWDFNYNRRLVEVTDNNVDLIPVKNANTGPQPGDVIRMDGFGRNDVYRQQPDGSYQTPTGFYTRLTRLPDSSFEERDYAGRIVRYASLDGLGNAPMTEIEDRNGNVMLFNYNQFGQLVEVIDTLGRPIGYDYDDEGRLERVTDFADRAITFTYDENGDLVEVTSPAVVGTPNGNDFPDGKTVRYGYSSGFFDQRLNHNLVSVTAPNEVASGGPPRLQVQYEEDPFAVDTIDRVVRQALGGTNDGGVPAGGDISYQYSLLDPGESPGVNTPVSQTTVNDRNGNVTEYQFNALGNIINAREFTNRDLRAGEPDFYETSFEYDGDGLVTRVVFPEGNSKEYEYDGQNPDRFQQGNLLSITKRPDERVGDQDTIQTTLTYEPIYNRTRSITEPRGNDPSYVPQNGGAHSPERYTTVYTFDYEESCDYDALAARVDRTATEVQGLLDQAGMCTSPLGDVNSDDVTDQTSGSVLRIHYRDVTLLPGSQQAQVEGGTFQPVVYLNVFNRFGQLVREVDAEGNITDYDYYPENDPDGDGQDLIPGRSVESFGYLRQVTVDVFPGPFDIDGNGIVDIFDVARIAVSFGLFDPEADMDGDGRVGATDIRLVADALGTSRAAIRTRFEYDPVGNIVRIIDGRGIATDYAVNQLNQVVQVTRSAAHGLLRPAPSEPLPISDFRYLERTFYDFNGNVVLHQVEDRGNTSMVDGNPDAADLPATAQDPDPAGGPSFVDTVYKYDILDNLIEVVQEVENGPRTRFLRSRYRYDANENEVLTIQPEGNATAAVYDERDLPFQSTLGAVAPSAVVRLGDADPTDYDVRGGTPATTTYHYDGNENLVELVDADDTDGSTDNNSTRSGDGDRTRYVYDGFDRLTSVADAVGNQEVYQYDPAGNVVRQSNFGPVGGPSPTSDGIPNIDLLPVSVSVDGVIHPDNLVTTSLLAATETLYDELGQAFQTDEVLLVNTIATQRGADVADGAVGIGKGDLTPGDDDPIPGIAGIEVLGRVSTRHEYDRDSRRTFMVEDDGDTTSYTYDGADRLVGSVDPEGNIIEIAYDDNGNVIETRETDVAQVAGVPDEIFITTYFYDALDRLQRVVDNLGQTDNYRYDSRDNLVAMADAQGPMAGRVVIRRAFSDGPTVVPVNSFGNVMRYAYDGINRMTLEESVLTSSGEGDGLNIGANIFGVKTTVPTPDPDQAGGDGIITTETEWDGNSLNSAAIDDNGNRTEYTYDDLDRVVLETKGICPEGSLADRCDPATSISYEYDRDHNVALRTDENGSQVRCDYDAIDRAIDCDVTRAPGVVGTSNVAYEYDGLSRLTHAFDNNEPGDPEDDSIATYAYDSLGRMVEETQKIGSLLARAVSSAWRADDLRTLLVYPNGRALGYTYDDLDRLRTVADQAARQPIAEYDYVGLSRILQRHYPSNGTRMTFLDDTGQVDVGYDGLRRPIKTRDLRDNGSLLVGFRHEYDRLSNKLSEVKLHDEANTESYEYDSAYRLTGFDRPEEGSSAPLHGRWTLDGVGNWKQVDGETRRHSSFNEITERDAGASVPVLSDGNGNQTDNGTFQLEYDYRNRLRRVTRKADGVLIATYSYDGTDRRIRKVVTGSGDLDGVTDYYYDDWQAVEERDGSDQVLRQYVYGLYLDEPLVMDRNLDGDDVATGSGDQRLFYHQNTLLSTFALTDAGGEIVEAYLYDAYGRQTVFLPGANGTLDFGLDDVAVPGGHSAVGNPFAFTGRRLDPESGLYYYRYRYMDPEQGRFIQRDPVGYQDGMSLYTYGLNNPVNTIDPLGLEGKSRQTEAGEHAGKTAIKTGVKTGVQGGIQHVLVKKGMEKAATAVTGVGGVITVLSSGCEVYKLGEALVDLHDANKAADAAKARAKRMEARLQAAIEEQRQQEAAARKKEEQRLKEQKKFYRGTLHRTIVEMQNEAAAKKKKGTKASTKKKPPKKKVKKKKEPRITGSGPRFRGPVYRGGSRVGPSRATDFAIVTRVSGD